MRTMKRPAMLMWPNVRRPRPSGFWTGLGLIAVGAGIGIVMSGVALLFTWVTP